MGTITSRSGQITIATAGAEQSGPTTPSSPRGHYEFAIKAHPDNTDTVWVGNNDNNVDAANGFPLNPGEGVVIRVRNLAELKFDSDAAGGKVCWLLLGDA